MMYGERGGNMCIADVAIGSQVSIKAFDGTTINGEVIRNYGASLYLRLADGTLFGVENGSIRAISITNKELVEEPS